MSLLHKVTIVNSTAAVANATGLTKGDYAFQLTVTDGAGNADSKVVKVKVKQDTNAAPTADAGKDMTVTLPLSQASPFLSFIYIFKVGRFGW